MKTFVLSLATLLFVGTTAFAGNGGEGDPTTENKQQVGINIGDIIERTVSGYFLNGEEFSISEELGDRILLRLLE